MKWTTLLLLIALLALATGAPGTTDAPGTTEASGTFEPTGTTESSGTTETSGTTEVSGTTLAPGTVEDPGTTSAPGTTKASPTTTTTATTSASPATSSAAPATSSAAPTTTTTEAPLMPGLHPTGSHTCAVNQIPMGAYQVQEQMPNGSVQMHHYLVCSEANSTYRGALVGVATARGTSCPADAPLYAGFNAGKGPCAPLAAGWKMTSTCKNGDNQGQLPAAVPANHIRYIGCLGIPGDTDYALTQYTTSNSGFREELQGVKCCKVVPV